MEKFISLDQDGPTQVRNEAITDSLWTDAQRSGGLAGVEMSRNASGRDAMWNRGDALKVPLAQGTRCP
jgi:hypothetical protein